MKCPDALMGKVVFQVCARYVSQFHYRKRISEILLLNENRR